MTLSRDAEEPAPSDLEAARLRTSASFAALCGTAPIPVSSGRPDRHRLSRGEDQQANAALPTTADRQSAINALPTDH